MKNGWLHKNGLNYESLNDLACKIDYEGGMEYFFTAYTSNQFLGSPFEKELKAYREAHENLYVKLDGLGLLSPEEE